MYKQQLFTTCIHVDSVPESTNYNYSPLVYTYIVYQNVQTTIIHHLYTRIWCTRMYKQQLFITCIHVYSVPECTNNSYSPLVYTYINVPECTNNNYSPLVYTYIVYQNVQTTIIHHLHTRI